MIKRITNYLDAYKIAVCLSSLSMVFGIIREFIIVGLLGFTTNNDKLQLSLSIFYTIGLSIDAVRLSCLNLYSILSLSRILISASLVGLPFSILIGLIMSYSTNGLDGKILFVSIAGSYLNLMASLLIIYKQRSDLFLAAQCINIMPNLILIPGIILCYWFAVDNLIFSIVCLTSLIPVLQCVLLLLLSNNNQTMTQYPSLSLFSSIMTFLRHFSAMIGEQLFQLIIRTACFNYGTGFLSVFAISTRIYSAGRFILIDSFISSKLSDWEKKSSEMNVISKMVNSTWMCLFIAITSLIISLHSSIHLIYSSLQIIFMLSLGFYFSTLVRIVYFKINRNENNSSLILRFAIYELICAMVAFFLTKQLAYPIFLILWLGYIAKPFAQLLLLRKRYDGLERA